MEKLKGKVAIITGATQGMGRATAELFASEGARVVVNGRNSTAGEDLVQMIRQKGGEALFIRADVREYDENQRLMETAVDAYGNPDILVLNAGILGLGSITGYPLKLGRIHLIPI